MIGPFSSRHNTPNPMNRETISLVIRALITPYRDIKMASLYTFCIFQGLTAPPPFKIGEEPAT
jgi:hypothetical protein